MTIPTGPREEGWKTAQDSLLRLTTAMNTLSKSTLDSARLEEIDHTIHKMIHSPDFAFCKSELLAVGEALHSGDSPLLSKTVEVLEGATAASIPIAGKKSEAEQLEAFTNAITSAPFFNALIHWPNEAEFFLLKPEVPVGSYLIYQNSGFYSTDEFGVHYNLVIKTADNKTQLHDFVVPYSGYRGSYNEYPPGINPPSTDKTNPPDVKLKVISETQYYWGDQGDLGFKTVLGQHSSLNELVGALGGREPLNVAHERPVKEPPKPRPQLPKATSTKTTSSQRKEAPNPIKKVPQPASTTTSQTPRTEPKRVIAHPKEIIPVNVVPEGEKMSEADQLQTFTNAILSARYYFGGRSNPTAIENYLLNPQTPIGVFLVCDRANPIDEYGVHYGLLIKSSMTEFKNIDFVVPYSGYRGVFNEAPAGISDPSSDTVNPRALKLQVLSERQYYYGDMGDLGFLAVLGEYNTLEELIQAQGGRIALNKT